MARKNRTSVDNARLEFDVQQLSDMLRYAKRYDITPQDADYARGLLEAILKATKSKSARSIFD